jgi:hypothetical protein
MENLNLNQNPNQNPNLNQNQKMLNRITFYETLIDQEENKSRSMNNKLSFILFLLFILIILLYINL